MSINGNLKTMQLAELLQWLSGAQKTGTLLIDNGQVQKRIFFGNGNIVSSSSSDPKEHLGHFLVSHGFITDEQLTAGVAEQAKTKVLLGKVLLAMGAISESDLEAMLRMKAEESIYEIFSWTEGDFRFLDDPPPAHMIPISLDVTGLVLEAMQRTDEWHRIRQVIPTPRCIPVATGPLDDDPDQGPGARNIVSLVDDDRTIEEICQQTHSSEFFACKVLYEQLRRGRLKVVKPRGAATAPLPMAVDADSLLRLGNTYLEQADYEKSVRHYRAARSLDPESKRVQGAAQKAEDRIRMELEKQGVLLTAVPSLSRRMEELTTVAISPQEGFILSRVNGQYDIASILKVSPMPPLEAQIVFWKLLKAGHVRLAPGRKVAPA